MPESSGWALLTSAESVNDHGQIVGFGTIGGQTRAFLMTPYDIALQDRQRGVTVLVNSLSGDYSILDRANGTLIDGRAEIRLNRCVLHLRDSDPGLRITFNYCQGVGSASFHTTGRHNPLTVVDNERGTGEVNGTCG